jgi:hypothetical protein
MTVGVDATGGSAESLRLARLHVEVQHFGMPPFKQAMARTGIDVRKKIDYPVCTREGYWDRDTVDGVYR